MLEPGREFIEGWALEAICEHLEAVSFGKITRLLINVPPGFMKSMLLNVFWPAWEWSALDMGSMRYVAFSYGVHLTERDNGRFRDLVTSYQFQEVWGHRVRLKETGVVRVSNDQTGWKFASSVGGVGTGERGDRVLLDDPHNVKESESETVRTETIRWFNEAMQNRLNDLREGAIIVIMQRVHESDVSAEILEHYADYVHLCIPMEYDPSRHCETSIGWTDPRTEPDELAWPDRFAEEELLPFRRQTYLWAGQYQQTPKPRGGGILQDTWWKLWDEDEARACGLAKLQYPIFEYIVACLDGAYTEKTVNDPSAMSVWGVFTDRMGKKKIMLIYAWAKHLRIRGTPPPRMESENEANYLARSQKHWGLVEWVAYTANRWKADRLLIENKATGISVAQELQRSFRDSDWIVQLIDPKGLDKVARAHAVSHILEQGLVYAPNTSWAQMVIDQCGSFPKAKHDDLVDTVTMALSHLRINGMAIMPDEDQRSIEDLMKHKSGQKPVALYPS